MQDGRQADWESAEVKIESLEQTITQMRVEHATLKVQNGILKQQVELANFNDVKRWCFGG